MQKACAEVSLKTCTFCFLNVINTTPIKPPGRIRFYCEVSDWDHSLLSMSQNPVARGSREPSKKVADAIDWTREKVEDMAKRGNVKKGKPPLPCGQYYLVKPVPKKGADSFVWGTLSREEAEGKLSCLSKHGLTCLNQDTFKKVSPSWLQVVFQSFNNVHTVLCPLYVKCRKVT